MTEPHFARVFRVPRLSGDGWQESLMSRTSTTWRKYLTQRFGGDVLSTEVPVTEPVVTPVERVPEFPADDSTYFWPVRYRFASNGTLVPETPAPAPTEAPRSTLAERLRRGGWSTSSTTTG